MDSDTRISLRGIAGVARFYLDEDISAELAALLRNAGHNVLTTDEAGPRAYPDSDQMLRAWSDDRILVTHNSGDFFMLHYAWTSWPRAWAIGQAPHHAGIATIPQPPRLTHSHAAVMLHQLTTSGIEIENDIVSWRPSGEWVPMRWRSSR